MDFIISPLLFKQWWNNLFRLFFIHSDEHFFSYFKTKPVRKIGFSCKRKNQIIIKQIQNKRETFFSVCVDYKIFIIQEKYYDSFLTTLKNHFSNSENLTVVDLSNDKKYSHPFFENISFNPHQYSHICTEIANFSKSLELQEIEIWPFIEDVLIGFIICKGYELSNNNTKLFSKKQERLFKKSDLIFLRSLKSNQYSNEISQTDLYYYLKDQSIYVIKTWNNNNQESMKKYEKEKTFFQTFTGFFFNFPHYFGQAVFEPPRPNLVIEFIRGENLQSILTNPNKSEHLSIVSKIKIILSIMGCIENLHFYGYVYRDLKFDNILVTGSDVSSRAATLIDFDACCKLPSKKCEPIDENPKYYFQEVIDYANDIITVLKVDRETNTRTFLKTISLNDNFNKSPPENSKLETPTETYGLTTDIGSNYFSSPEQRTSSKYTYASDVYSFGKFMYYLCIGEIPNEQTEKHIKFPPEYSFLEKLYKQCTRENPSERPNISIVINKFVKLIGRLNNDQIANLIFIWDKKDYYLFGLRFSNFYTLLDKRDGFTYDIYVLNMACSMANFLHISFVASVSVIHPLLYTRQIIKPMLSQLFLLLEYYHFEQNVLNGKSLGILGRLLYEGIFVPQNKILSRMYLMEGALRNDSFSQFYLARLFLDRNFHCNMHTLTIANNLLETATRTGSPTRINYLALRYIENTKSSESISRVIDMCKKSAEQDYNSEAQAIVGLFYYKKQDFSQAIYFLERSSTNYAKFILAQIYLGGYPEFSDNQKGLYYLKLAADNQVADAQFLLSYFYIRQKLASEAFKYLTLASKNNSTASFLLFCLYTAGIFPQKGFEKSLKFLKSSIEQANPMALQIYTQLTRKSKNHSPDLNDYIKSIPSSRQSLSCFVNLITSSKNLSDDPQSEENFLDHLYDWYLFTFDYDCDIREFLYFRNLLISFGQLQKINEFCNFAIKDGQEGDMKALTFINDYSDLTANTEMIKFLLVIEQPLADSNNSGAQWFLASKLLYCSEYRDLPKGIHYLKAAAKNNHPAALYALGLFYLNGKLNEYEIPVDVNLGMNMLRRAAEKGSVSAQCDLSPLLVRNDLHLAFFYAKESISKGCIDAYFPLALCYLRMMKNPGDSFCQKAIECLNMTENKYHVLCKVMLAMIYYDGILASKDEEKSFLLYTELVNTPNSVYIHNNLGVILKNGSQSVPKNIPLAIAYFETAIKQGDIFALFNLSRMYFYGEGVPKNIDKAAALLDKLNMSQFDISIVLDYIQLHPMMSTQIFNESSDNCDMNQLLPTSYRQLFPKKCFDSIDFVYSIDYLPFVDILSETLTCKPLKSKIVTTTFYEGLL